MKILKIIFFWFAIIVLCFGEWFSCGGGSVASEVRSMIDELKSKVEKDRWNGTSIFIFKTRLEWVNSTLTPNCISIPGSVSQGHFQRALKRSVENKDELLMIRFSSIFGFYIWVWYNDPKFKVIVHLQCENCLKNETTKFQEIYEKFCKEKAAHLQALKGSSF